MCTCGPRANTPQQTLQTKVFTLNRAAFTLARASVHNDTPRTPRRGRAPRARLRQRESDDIRRPWNADVGCLSRLWIRFDGAVATARHVTAPDTFAVVVPSARDEAQAQHLAPARASSPATRCRQVSWGPASASPQDGLVSASPQDGLVCGFTVLRLILRLSPPDALRSRHGIRDFDAWASAYHKQYKSHEERAYRKYVLTLSRCAHSGDSLTEACRTRTRFAGPSSKPTCAAPTSTMPSTSAGSTASLSAHRL